MQNLNDLLNEYKAACQNFAYAKVTHDMTVMQFDREVHLLRSQLFKIMDDNPHLENTIMSRMDEIHLIASEYALEQIQSISYH